MEFESKNPVQVYVMDENQIKEICEVSSKAAISAYKEEVKREKKKITDRRKHNTDILLRNYKMFRLSMENAVYSLKSLEEEMKADEILSLMMDRDDDVIMQSIRESKAKTVVIMKHIDRMLNIYKAFCEQSPDELELRRYNVMYDKYIAEETLSVAEIADKNFMSSETVYGDLRIAKERFSMLVFGMDGIQ